MVDLTKFELRNGDVILVHNYTDNLNPLPVLIQASTRCYYHHCAIYLNRFIYESVAKGVQNTHSLEDYLKGIGAKREVAICRFPEVILKEITEQEGLKYNFGSLLVQLFNQIVDIYLGSKNPKSRNCAQYIAKCLGWKDWAKTDPQDIYREAKNRNLIIWESHPKRAEYINNKLS
jgi:hypothetical protein